MQYRLRNHAKISITRNVSSSAVAVRIDPSSVAKRFLRALLVLLKREYDAKPKRELCSAACYDKFWAMKYTLQSESH